MSSLAMKTNPERRSSGNLLRFLRSCVSSPLNVLLTAALLALAFVGGALAYGAAGLIFRRTLPLGRLAGGKG